MPWISSSTFVYPFMTHMRPITLSGTANNETPLLLFIALTDLDLAAVGGLLVDSFTIGEAELGVLEGGGGAQGELVAVLDQLDDGRDGVAHLAGHQTHACNTRPDKRSEVEP